MEAPGNGKKGVCTVLDDDSLEYDTIWTFYSTRLTVIDSIL